MDLEQYKQQGYLPTIGIECHVQLKTNTKLFAGVANDAREAEPNSLISHICLGMPGALPVLNQKAVDLAVRASFALGVAPQKFSKFDRKHYFYPDLPKGYQITQFEYPIILGGFVDIKDGEKSKRINITRAHLEEDAGKNSHPVGKDYSLVDLNRAGTPLLEIVSEPEIHSASQAKAYAHQLFLLMRYSGVSEADLYQGNMRFDVNVSVSKTSQLGTRTETKNLNSFKSVEKAVEFEIKRQIKILESEGQVVVQETRGWDDAKQKTFSQRSKEESHDYRYFPEPDLPPIVLDDSLVKEIKDSMPVMPNKLYKSFKEFDLADSTINTLIDNMPAGKFVFGLIKSSNKIAVKRIANWLATDVQAVIIADQKNWEDISLNADDFIALSQLIETNQINSTGAKQVLNKLINGASEPIVIARELDILQVSDESSLIKIVKQVIDENPKAVADINAGQAKVFGFLVGQVMKQSKGKANPELALQLIKKELKI